MGNRLDCLRVRAAFFSLLVCIVLSFLPSAWSQERERLRVSTLFIGSSLLPLWIAQDQGYFARQGVNVELIWMQSTLSAQALLAGEVDVIFGTPQTMFAALTSKNPPPLAVIGAWASASEHWLVVHSSIRAVKELEGKALATSRPKSADHGYAVAILERFNVDPRRVTFLGAGGQGSRLLAVESGRASGSVFNRYYTLQLKKKGFPDSREARTPRLSVSAFHTIRAKRCLTEQTESPEGVTGRHAPVGRETKKRQRAVPSTHPNQSPAPRSRNRRGRL